MILDVNTINQTSTTDFWSILSSIATVLACIVAAVYTIATYKILSVTSKAAKATSDAAIQNATANELSAYLELRKDLTSEVFWNVSSYAYRKDLTSNEDKIVITQNINSKEEWEIIEEILYIRPLCLIKAVLNNIEDLAIFLDKGVLTIETIDAGFGYSLLYIGNNDTIRNFIKEQNNSGSSVYGGFENLYALIYDKLKPEEKEKYKSTLF